MTRPLSELDHAYLEAHEQSRRLHQPPRPLPAPDEIRAAHGRLVALSRALTLTERRARAAETEVDRRGPDEC